MAASMTMLKATCHAFSSSVACVSGGAMIGLYQAFFLLSILSFLSLGIVLACKF
jgi:hypothetical protein